MIVVRILVFVASACMIWLNTEAITGITEDCDCSYEEKVLAVFMLGGATVVLVASAWAFAFAI